MYKCSYYLLVKPFGINIFPLGYSLLAIPAIVTSLEENVHDGYPVQLFPATIAWLEPDITHA